ncbi:MAG: Na+/H+ antiporter subunit C [Caldilineaceae bacterium]
MELSIDLTALMLALVVGCLMGTGTYLILRRGQIRLILGLGLFSHAINLLLFGTGPLTRGQPPVIADKANYLDSVAQMADPLPQALILTAIVISFGMTAFIVVLVSRRDALTGSDAAGAKWRLFSTHWTCSTCRRAWRSNCWPAPTRTMTSSSTSG